MRAAGEIIRTVRASYRFAAGDLFTDASIISTFVDGVIGGNGGRSSRAWCGARGSSC
jgi:hypothetical protein